jgi:hypothetical protein
MLSLMQSHNLKELVKQDANQYFLHAANKVSTKEAKLKILLTFPSPIPEWQKT